MGISRFMRNGKQGPFGPKVKGPHPAQGCALLSIKCRLVLRLWNSNCCTDSFALK